MVQGEVFTKQVVPHDINIMVSLKVWRRYEAACKEGFMFIFDTEGMIVELYYKLYPRTNFLITGYMEKFHLTLNIKTEWNRSVKICQGA